MTSVPHSDIVFIYGALRSGTTVFRLMLDAHPQLSNPGEMDFLFDHLTPDASHATGWRYDLDALQMDRIFRSYELETTSGADGLDLLESFLDQLRSRASGKILSINLHRHIDRAAQIMPDVRILHILRDPRDVARSSIQMGWAGTLYHAVGHWIETELSWKQTSTNLSSQQSLEITYEGLFRDIETTLNTVCAFFDIPFEEGMLRYHENSTYGPPDVSLTEQWKRKCSPEELAPLESRAGSLMETCGYTRSQPHSSLSALTKAQLVLNNKIYVWKFGMKRFGPMLYWCEKLTRWAGLKTPHKRFKLRMQQISVQHLK